MKEEPFEEYLKKVIPPTKELREYMQSLKSRPPVPPEKVEAQLRAGGAWRGRVPRKPNSESTGGHDETKQQGT